MHQFSNYNYRLKGYHSDHYHFFKYVGFNAPYTSTICGEIVTYSKTNVHDDYKITYYTDLNFAEVNITRSDENTVYTKWMVCNADESYCVEDVYTKNDTTLYMAHIPNHAKVWAYPTSTLYIVNSSLPEYLSNENVSVPIGQVRFYFFDTETNALLDSVNFNISGDDFSDSGVYDYYVTYTSDQLTQGNTYSYTASRDGYKTVSGSFTFTGGQVIKLYFKPDLTSEITDPTNNTALTFTVLDSETKEAISGAYVTVNGKTKITNSDGFTWFEVPKNDTYSYTVSAQGYFTISGSVEVGTEQEDITVELMPISATPTTTSGSGDSSSGSTAGTSSLNEGIQELYFAAPALIRLAILVAMMSMFGMLMRAVRRR